MNHAPRMVALACVAFCCVGCGAGAQCRSMVAAAIALDTDCAAVGLARRDPTLLVACASAYGSVRTALAEGSCKDEVTR